MRITARRRKRIIQEDLTGFMEKSKDISYRGFVQDPTFDLVWNKKNKAAARSIKQIWSQEADHEFMSKVIKIHWLKRAGLEEKLQGFLSMSRRNEISTMGYLPGSDTFMANWGPIGVVVQGRTTLAANRMSTLLSGYGERLSPEITGKYAASGTPKRATFFAGTADRYETSLAGEYILDRDSFDPAGQGGNEFIVGNWTPIGVALAKPVREIMFNQAMGDMYTGVKETEIGGYIAAVESTGLPWTSVEDEFNVRLWKDRVGSKQQVNESAGQLRQLIREVLETSQSQYSFLPDNVAVEDFAKIIKSRARAWTATWADGPPVPREEYVNLLQSLDDEYDRQTVQFILDVWDLTAVMPPAPVLDNIAAVVYRSLGVDLDKAKVSGLAQRAGEFYNELFKSGGYFKKLDHYLRAPFDKYEKQPVSQVLAHLRQHLKYLPIDLFDDMLAVYELYPMFLTPISLPADMDYLKDNLGDMAMSGVDGLRQAAEICKMYDSNHIEDEL